MKKRNTKGSRQSGFGLVEVLVAMIVVVIALVNVVALFSHSISTMRLAQEDLIAKQKARESLESIYSARNTSQITFEMIQNVSNGGVFLDGPQDLTLPNPSGGGGDGLVGTADDGPIEELRMPGPDGELGNGDDEITPLNNFQREIQITGVLNGDGSTNPDLRQVTITISYSTSRGWNRNYAVTSLVSRFR